MANQQIPGGLAQQYGQIILGYLAELVIMFDAIKEKEIEKETKIIGSGNLQSIITKIENAFGDIQLDQEFSEQHNQPVVTWVELHNKVNEYLARFNQPFDEYSYRKIMQDLIDMKVIIPHGILTLQDKFSDRFIINTRFFQKSEIEKVAVSFETALQTRLKGCLSNEVAREVLLVLSRSGGLSDQELQTLPANLRSGLFFSRYGRGSLLSRVRAKGVKYDPFMKIVDKLVSMHILVEGCSDLNQEFIILNPVLKPFSVIAEIIERHQKKNQETNILEVEVSNGAITPLEHMVNLGLLNANDLFIFSGFDFEGP